MTSPSATIPQTCQRLPPGLRAAAFCTACSRPSGSADSVRSIARLLAFLADAAAIGISPTRASEDCSSISRAIAAFGHDLAAGGVALVYNVLPLVAALESAAAIRIQNNLVR